MPRSALGLELWDAELPQEKTPLVRHRLVMLFVCAAHSPRPLTNSTRNKIGLLLDVAACSRAAIFAISQGSTRVSFMAVLSRTEG